MAESYSDAAVRHLEDATSLRGAGRYDNAGHLVGFAAECAIKVRMLSLQGASGSPQLHLPDLLIAARKRFGERNGYLPMYNLLKGDIFATWNVNRRYTATGDTTVVELDAWLVTTKRLFAAAGLKVQK